MFGVHIGAFHGGVMRIENTEITRSGQAGESEIMYMYWVILGYTGLYWVILGYIGSYWDNGK